MAATKVDFILVLCHFIKEGGEEITENFGDLSEEFKVRLEEAAEIQHGDPGLFIVNNGGQTAGTPRSQGRAAHDYLVSLGVPDEKIIWSDRGHDTFDELNDAMAIMRKRGWYGRPIVVSNWMQLAQVWVVFFRLGIAWKAVPTKLRLYSPKYFLLRVAAIPISIIWPRGSIMQFLRDRRATKGQAI